MGQTRKYHWTGEDAKSAEDRALDTFAELMMERIKAIDKDWQKPWIEKGSFVMPRNLSGRPYNGINTFGHTYAWAGSPNRRCSTRYHHRKSSG